MQSERRRWQRVHPHTKTFGVGVNCDAVEHGVLLRLETADSAAAVLNTYACDVSLGGLAFEVHPHTKLFGVGVKKDIALPDPLPLKVFLPHAHTPLDCSSRIAWQRLIPPPTAGPEGRSAGADPPSADAAGGGMNEQTAHIGVAFPQLSEEQHDDVARVAHRYHDWCEVEQGRGTGGIVHG